MKRLLKMSLEARTSRDVVIIKGNPDKMQGMESLAQDYYDEIANYVKGLGFEVIFDPGEPMTCPPLDAVFWIAHSRGVDRIRCIEPEDQWRFLKFGDIDGVIHPTDARWQKSITDQRTTKEKPPKEHFEFIEEQKKAIDDLVKQL